MEGIKLESNDAYITNTSHDHPQMESTQNIAYIPTPSIPVEPNAAYATTSIPVEANTAYMNNTNKNILTTSNAAYAPVERDKASSDQLYDIPDHKEEQAPREIPDQLPDYDYVIM